MKQGLTGCLTQKALADMWIGILTQPGLPLCAEDRAKLARMRALKAKAEQALSKWFGTAPCAA